MVRSLAAIGAVVAVVVLLVPRPDVAVVQPVEVAVAARGAQPEASFDLVVPAVPQGWTATSVRFQRDSEDAVPTWHVGYLTAEEGYAALEVAAAATSAWVTDQTSDGERAERLEVGGQSWQVLRSDDPARTSLLLEQGDLTIVVTGSAVLDELVTLAEAALAARP